VAEGLAGARAGVTGARRGTRDAGAAVAESAAAGFGTRWRRTGERLTGPLPADAGPEVADVAAVPVPVPYIRVLVAWMTPGSSVIPRTATWWPAVSVSLTVNGPAPAPDDAIQ